MGNNDGSSVLVKGLELSQRVEMMFRPLRRRRRTAGLSPPARRESFLEARQVQVVVNADIAAAAVA